MRTFPPARLRPAPSALLALEAGQGGFIRERDMRNSPLQRQKAAEFLRRVATTHGLSKSLTWRAWQNMKKRCSNPNYHAFNLYGGRGITVCDRWARSFEDFLSDVGERPGEDYSLDRIDGNGNYEPGNCRWATSKEQARSRRNALFVEFNGESRPLSEWAEITGIAYHTLYSRLGCGWTIERAFATRKVKDVRREDCY